jgi:endonuclease/exonuclease/phosphatase (EEP) superfamily protein YafD
MLDYRRQLRGISNVSISLIEIALYISCLLTLLCFCDKLGWLWSLPCHFRLQYLLAQLLALATLLSAKAWKPAGLAALFSIINLTQIAPYYLPQTGGQSTGPTQRSVLRLLQYNINSRNKNYRALVNYVREINPDLVAVEEATPECCSVLSKSLADYPYMQAIPRWDNFGLVLFSRFPLSGLNTLDFPEGFGTSTPNCPSSICRVKLASGSLTLIHTHLLNALTEQTFALQSLQIEKIAQARAAIQGDVILVGDLNTTPWCYLMPKLTDSTALKDCGLGLGIISSWPTTLPLIQIPIDHCLVSERLTVLKHIRGPQLGSDHFPIYTEIAVPR